jgi:hypothetical protein
MTKPAPGAPFRHALGTGVFAGRVLLDGANESLVELFPQPTGSDSLLGADSSAAPPTLAESSVEAGPAGAFNVAMPLSFYDTN